MNPPAVCTTVNEGLTNVIDEMIGALEAIGIVGSELDGELGKDPANGVDEPLEPPLE